MPRPKGFKIPEEVKEKIRNSSPKFRPWLRGKKHSDEHNAKISASLRKRYPIPFNHQAYREAHREKQRAYVREHYREHHNKYLEYAKRYRQTHKYIFKEEWKVAKRLWNERNKERRHKEYKVWQLANRDRLRAKYHTRLVRKKLAGELKVKTIQMIYEDNIKKHGTLTCYLCLKQIPFQKDHLEHKIPLARGGTNLYENLAVACQRCNITKRDKTESEYRHYLEVVKDENSLPS